MATKQGFSFRKIKGKEVEGDFEIEDMKLHIVVNANALTAAKMEEIHQNIARKLEAEKETGLNNQVAQTLGMAQFLAVVIKSWDATDGKPEFEFFKTLPLGMLSDLMEFVMSLVAPKAQTAQA